MLSPPTDNLYKFMAIFGLVLIVVGFGFNSQIDRDFNQALTSILVEDAKVGDILIQQSKKSADLATQLKETDMTSDKGVKEATRILNEMRSLRTNRDDLERSESHIRAKTAYEQVKRHYIRTNLMGLMLMMSGALVAAAGFWWWYQRLQRYMDKAVRSEAQP